MQGSAFAQWGDAMTRVMWSYAIALVTEQVQPLLPTVVKQKASWHVD